MPNHTLAKKDVTIKHPNAESPELKSYDSVAMQLSRFNDLEETAIQSGDWNEYNTKGGREKHQRLRDKVKHTQTIDNNTRKIQSDAGNSNQYQKAEFQQTNGKLANSKLDKSHNGTSMRDKIVDNKDITEGLSKELSEIRYLIEYMDNNKKQKL
jgi:hypothetical protein